MSGADRVLTLDLATRYGWSRLDPDTGELLHGAATLRHRVGKNTCPTTRLRSAVQELSLLLAHVAWGGRVVVERPTTRAKSAGPIRVANELFAVLRLLSDLLGVAELIEVPVKDLKKFTTDNGNASKDEMVAAVNERWGYSITDDNEADAVALHHYYREVLACQERS